ncbi:MAG: DNA repair protein RecO [Gemmatimonadaceae bacterium]|nr:DNA repair protein RecO [Gemmatimonadaceae bacterium]MCW5825013.1 DNA repair protein RecO [Gemmatimonadaceae bacterium]
MIETAAIVLHAFDYRETSRIVRLATRDAGVLAAVAKGAKRPKSRFGQGLDLFTGGAAQLLIHPSKDLHTLVAFDAQRARPALAGSLQRFGAASALAELSLRFGTDATAGVHDALQDGLDRLTACAESDVTAAALAVGWRIVAELGFAPTLETCALCHRDLGPDEDVRFAHRSGGAVCATCRTLVPGTRTLPASARTTLIGWMHGQEIPVEDIPTAKAHQRLLREFLEEHLGDGRAFQAFQSWERLSA